MPGSIDRDAGGISRRSGFGVHGRPGIASDHLGFEVFYVHRGVVRKYRPDFLIRLTSGDMLVLETKGRDSDRDRTKRRFLAEWVEAVNAHSGFGRSAWDVVLGGDALREKVGHDHGPEAVGGDDGGKPGRLEAALENGADGPRLEGAWLEARPSACERTEERSVLRVIGDAGDRQVGREPFVQVVADGDFAFPAALLAEPEGAEIPKVAEILEAESGDGADTGAGVGQGAEEGAVAQAGEPGGVEGLQEAAGLIGSDLGCLSLAGGAGWPANGLEGVEEDGMAGDEQVEEAAERGQRGPLVRGCWSEVRNEACRDPRGDAGQLDDIAVLAPGQEAQHPAGVSQAGVRIGELGGEEFLGRKTGAGSCPVTTRGTRRWPGAPPFFGDLGTWSDSTRDRPPPTEKGKHTMQKAIKDMLGSKKALAMIAGVVVSLAGKVFVGGSVRTRPRKKEFRGRVS